MVAIAPPEGTALSWSDRGRATSVSASSAVSWKPPAGSAKCARIASADSPRRREPALVGGRLVEGQEPVPHAGLVLQGPGVARLPVLPRAAEAPVRRTQHRRAAGPPRARRSPDSAPRPAQLRVVLPRKQPAASANAPSMSPFQPARALSSRAGWGRRSRAASSAPRAALEEVAPPRRAAARCRSARPVSVATRRRITRPSQLPASVTS